MSETTVLVTGGFDPLHSGHIEYFKEAKKLGNKLVVGLNSDEWLTNKKGKPFMPLNERMEIVGNLSMVDEIITFEDDKENSSIEAIIKVVEKNPDSKIIFANGGDRTSKNIPEMESFKDNPNIEFVFGVGGDYKKNSSSWIVDDWKSPKSVRPWGWYKVIDEKPGYKVKEILVNPKSRLSLQSHTKRSETWVVIKGQATVTLGEELKTLDINQSIHIPVETKHRIENKLDQPLVIIEIQMGSYFGEDDIQRYEDDYQRT